MAESTHYLLARRLADQFQKFPQVEAVALAGSLTSGAETDKSSDIDLCVYTTGMIPPEAREMVVEQMGGASRADLNLDYWGPGDEWFDAQSGIEVDSVYWDTRWMEGMLDRVLRLHQGSLGYSTCFWHTVLTSQVLFDRKGWFGRLQNWSRQPYPETLRQDIIARNIPVLRDIIPSYLHQVEKAVWRSDLVSINHRVSALLASYFDVIFAFNRVLHPGEKRLVMFAERLCPRLPENMAGQVHAVLNCTGTVNKQLIVEVNRLVDGLENMLAEDALPGDKANSPR